VDSDDEDADDLLMDDDTHDVDDPDGDKDFNISVPASSST
jgi:hypothetical protein